MDEYEHRILELEEKYKEFEKSMRRIENTLTRTDERYITIMREIEGMSKTLEELKNRPAQNWGFVVSSAISAIVGALIGIIMHGGFINAG